MTISQTITRSITYQSGELIMRGSLASQEVFDFGKGIDLFANKQGYKDLVLGRLFLALGPLAFMSRVKMRNVDSAVRAVLDRSILLRMSQVTAGGTE